MALFSATMNLHLDGLRKELADLELCIAKERLRLEQLEARKLAVQSELNGFIFPVLTLPLEITTEIFLRYAADVHSAYDVPFGLHDWLSRRISVLLKVCRAWTTLALSVPALWATLNVGSLPARRQAPGAMKALVDTWFSRAGALPLSFTWFGGSENVQMNPILCQHAPRLQHLHLLIYLDSTSHKAGGISFPHLQSLDITHRFFHPVPVSTARDMCFSVREAPQLRHVRIDHIPPSALTLPCERLETFIAIDVTPQECLNVIRGAPSLRSFEFYGFDDDSYDEQPIISHAQLASFQLFNDNLEMMRYLALPALEELHFGHLPSLDDDILLPFLSRSCAPLRKFSFSTLQGPPLFISVHWFRHMRHLTALELPYLQLQSRLDLVRALNCQHEPELLPALESLVFENWKPDEFDAQLLEALDTRRTGPELEDRRARNQLKSFRFIWNAEPYPNLVSASDMASLVDRHRVALRNLRSRGMDIHVGTGDQSYV
ncbi:hypothetical protein B0H14DRAFT_2764520 [Mycena olivaceomarginata]|nr:hypothetical protein B0H14DRAFT_2764520 [Mycena olivaceomarginata]